MNFLFRLLSVAIIIWGWHTINRLPIIEISCNNKTKCRQTFPFKITLRRPYVMARLRGGLGNHMFIYASLYGMGRKTSRRPIVCGDRKLRLLFVNLTAVQFKSLDICEQFTSNSIIKLREVRNRYYDVRIIDHLKKQKYKNVFVSGFFQSLGYFIEYTDDLKEQFVIKETYRDFAQRYLHNITNQKLSAKPKEQVKHRNSPIFVAVHVRRGDKIQIPSILPPPSYFEKANDYFREKYLRNVIFIVVTNGLSWSKAHLKGDDVYFTSDSGTKTTQQDFAIAVACNHTVTSVGTYGWWIGLLAGGEVIYWKNYYKTLNNSLYLDGHYFPHYFKGISE